MRTGFVLLLMILWIEPLWALNLKPDLQGTAQSHASDGLLYIDVQSQIRSFDYRFRFVRPTPWQGAFDDDSCVAQSCETTGARADGLNLRTTAFPRNQVTREIIIGNWFECQWWKLTNGFSGSVKYNSYQRIEIDSCSLSFDKQGLYLIKEMVLGEDAKVSLGGGEYFIENLWANGGILNTAGAVKIYIRDTLWLGNGAVFNGGGDPARLKIFSYADYSGAMDSNIKSRLSAGSLLHALFYGEGDLWIDGANTTLTGAVNSHHLYLSSGARLIAWGFDPNGFARLQFATEAIATSCAVHPITVQVTSGGQLKEDYAGVIYLDAPAGAKWSLIAGQNSQTFTGSGQSMASYGMGVADGGEAMFGLQYDGAALLELSASATGALSAQTAVHFAPSNLDLVAADPPAGGMLTANRSARFFVRALGENDCQLDTGMSGEKIATFAFNYHSQNRAEPATRLQFSNDGVDWLTPWRADTDESIALNFSSGIAPLWLRYPDAGSLDVQLTLDEGLRQLSGQTSLYYRPDALWLDSIYSEIPVRDNPSGTASQGGAFTAAGNPFTVKVKALMADCEPFGSSECVTPSYQRDGEIMHVDAPIFSFEPGVNQSVGELQVESSTAFEAGYASARVRYSEVGDLHLSAQSQLEFVQAPLSAQISVVQSTPVGRFYPAWLEVTRNDLSAKNSCLFSYLDNPSVQLDVEISAKNAQDAEVRNYSALSDGGEPLYTMATTLGLYADVSAGFTLLPTDLQNELPASSWFLGRYTLSETVGLSRSLAEVGPLDEIRLGIRASGGDGEQVRMEDPLLFPSTLHPEVNFGGQSLRLLGDLSQIGGQPRPFRSGRLALSDSKGPIGSDLHLPIRLQYWDGSQFVTHSDDHCSELVDSSLMLNQQAVAANTSQSKALLPVLPVCAQGALGCVPIEGGVTQASYNLTPHQSRLNNCQGQGMFEAPQGDYGLLLCAATGLNDGPIAGRVEAEIQLSEGYRYLMWWDGSQWQQPPKASVEWGGYRGDDRIQYRRYR